MKREKSEAGFTLTEVLVALLVTGIILAVSLRFFTEQWRIGQTLKDRNEAHYAVMNAGRTVLDAIREGTTVEWNSTTSILTVLPAKQLTNPDQYSIGDKDYDGVKDLYRTHLGVPNPVVSGILSWNCSKGEMGLWTITLKAKVGSQTIEWQGSVRQRTTLLANVVLLPF